MRALRRFLLPFMLLFAAASPALAVPHASPDAFVAALGEEVVAILRDTALSAPQREARYRAMLDASFDSEATGRTALGRYWAGASEAQRQAFQPLYRDYLVSIYAARFARFSGETFKVTGTKPAAGGDINVTSLIQPAKAGGQPYEIVWRVRQEGSEYRIVDAVADGVSLLVTHNQEFASIIQNNGGNIDALLDQLRARAQRKPG
jgi:phospholipid transport system substrate-binding protein